MNRCSRCGRERKIMRRGLCGACYEYRRTRDQAYGRWQSRYVDAEPARLHVKALQAAGLGTRRIAALTGLNRKALQWLTTGRSERGAPPSRRILAGTAKAILAVPVPEVAHRVVAPRQLVDATGTIRRLQALVAFGYPRYVLAARLGVTPGNATHWFKFDQGRVKAETAQRVERLFNELQMTPGPSDTARAEGKRHGWLPPFDWEEDELDHFTVDVDAVAAEPDPAVLRRQRYQYRHTVDGGVCPVQLDDRHDGPSESEPEQAQQQTTVGELVVELRELGYSDVEIASRLNIQLASLERRHIA